MGTGDSQSQAQPQVFEATYILQNFLNFSQTFEVLVMAVRGSSVMSSGLVFRIAGAVIVRTGAKEQKLGSSVQPANEFRSLDLTVVRNTAYVCIPDPDLML